jgi:hypothetical protein
MVVVVVISFSIIVLCIIYFFVVVTVGIMYIRTGSRIEENINILFDGENISFDANLVMYINSTNIPPIVIINKMYKNQTLLYIVPLIKHTMMVCISSINPMAIGCFLCVNINLVIVLRDIKSFVISEGILYKILVLGINEMVLIPFL